MKKAAVVVGLLMAGLILSPGMRSQDKDHAELAKALAAAKVSLEQALSASTSEGKPVSGKFEVEEGKLQLSVYAAKDDKFSEVIVDHNTGKVTKTEAITSGEDLTAAQMQTDAMAKAKQSLHATLAKALKANPQFRAVSIFPALKDGHPVAEVTLIKGEQWKTESEKLD